MIKNIIFDFDGVILDSVPVKTEAFRQLFEGFPKDEIEKLIEYHIQNGGKSRYVKIKYFFENILKTAISKEEIQQYADKYSILTKEELANEKYLIKEIIDFIKNNYRLYNMHIASGADEEDLKYICKKLQIDNYFISINGSPKEKKDIIKDIINKNNYKKDETILIGDSINDYEAAIYNGIQFFGYNNLNLKVFNENIIYINNMKIFFEKI